MSVDATRWAWMQTGLKPACKLVLLAMADRADESGKCWPSVERMKVDTGLNRKTILNAMQTLQQLEMVADSGERRGRTKRIIVYQLIGVPRRETVPKQAPLNSPETGTVKQSQKRNGSENGIVPFLPTNGPKNGTTKWSQKRDTEPTSIEPTKEPISKGARARALPDDWQPGERLAEWFREQGFDFTLANMAEEFRDGCQAKGYRYVDFDAAFRKWSKKRQERINHEKPPAPRYKDLS